MNETISFNSEGFNHLRFKIDGKARSQSEQIHKINFLPFVRSVISKATSIEEHRKIGRNEYWALVAPIGKGKLKIRVVVKRKGKGKIHFWSVMNIK